MKNDGPQRDRRIGHRPSSTSNGRPPHGLCERAAIKPSALLPSRKLSRPARLARLATSLAALGLVFMGAIVVPVYLVPALTAVLVAGLVAERRLGSLPLRGALWVTQERASMENPAHEEPGGVCAPV
jgi:hypothetical protein